MAQSTRSTANKWGFLDLPDSGPPIGATPNSRSQGRFLQEAQRCHSDLYTTDMSRFVSAGTHEDPPERSDEWLAAQQELDANRARREQEARQDTGKSLYETLQANKGIAQEASIHAWQVLPVRYCDAAWATANMLGFRSTISRQARGL